MPKMCFSKKVRDMQSSFKKLLGPKGVSGGYDAENVSLQEGARRAICV